MPDVIGIRFKSCGKIYSFEINGLDVKEGDFVVVESDFGLSLGKVVMGQKTIEKSDRELKRVVRMADDEDFKTNESNKELEKEARDFCLERIMARGLPMKLVATEATLDRRRIVFYFTAEGRIDFRELVKDLAARFRTRIEMRQIGVRDEAKLVGGFGVCGRPLCCNTFLAGFEPVSIKMAKKQEMVLNIGKLSGLCSRLMCCLRYEYDGDLGTISADDEIPLGSEDAPVEVIEKKISRAHHREKKTHADRAQAAHNKADTASVSADPSTSEGQNPDTPDQQKSNEEVSADHETAQKNRRKHRRRRFKK
ncbi:MAG TPA: stage 0 sporulation family protein [Dissulfurispiraceae bacterium]|nr:stage 0 sporulation family protein [Dissulfurispiraceae bacterium]